MSKFSDVKVGDRLWSIKWNCWGTVIDIHRDEKYPIHYNADVDAFTTVDYNGRSNKDGVPILYWNEIHLPTDEEDKKPFNLVQYLKENLEPKKFKPGEGNCYFNYSFYYGKWEFWEDMHAMQIGTIYFEKFESSTVIKKLNEQKITVEQLAQAFKQLGWL